MAVWQFEFIIVPKEKITKQKNDFEETCKTNNSEEIVSWEGYSINEESIEEISKILIPIRGWDDSIIQLGCSEETCLELYYEKEILHEISFRLDLRSLTHEIFDKVIKFIKHNNAVILINKNNFIEPENQNLIAEIKKSDAYKFCQNPRMFFDELRI